MREVDAFSNSEQTKGGLLGEASRAFLRKQTVRGL